MRTITEKNYEDIKENLLFGYLSPQTLHTSLIAFFVVGFILMGIASFAVF